MLQQWQNPVYTFTTVNKKEIFMGNRTGVYSAFNGCGTTNPTDSDIRFFNTLKMWNESDNFDFSFTDSHAKTASVKDTSDKEKTLFPRLQQRLNLSKVFFLIVTENTINGSDVLDFEIEKAIDHYELPLILAFTGEDVIKNVTQTHLSRLPKSLIHKINQGKVKALFIPFKLKAIKSAIRDFNVQKNELKFTNYTYKTVDNWN